MSCLTLPTVTAEERTSEHDHITVTNPTTSSSLLYSNELLITAALQYGLMAYDPFMLDCFRPYTLRSRLSTTQFKPIPHNDRIDLEAFRRKSPEDWNMDDVIGWMISVAKKHKIPVEDMNMHRFANCTGSLLSLMNQKNFIERDNTFGNLLFNEFRQMLKEKSSIANSALWLRSCGSMPSVMNLHNYDDRQAATSSAVDELIHDFGQRKPPTTFRGSRNGKPYPMKQYMIEESAQTSTKPSCSVSGGKGKRIKDEVDGGQNPPPKVIKRRAQRTTGNKLWEFIRDILVESEKSPSVVRWENKSEGVFRIVDSEKLARLWGEKKSNRNMTYEKLSRAMRTYYEKKILVPVPKTGLYPKKLVYKFGPNAVSASASSLHSAKKPMTVISSGKNCSRGVNGHVNKDKIHSWKAPDYEMVSDPEDDD